MRKRIFILLLFVFFVSAFSVWSNSMNVELVGRWDGGVDGIRIYAANGYAYLCIAEDGKGSLIILDVREPSKPMEVGRIKTLGQPSEVFVSGNYAYVANYYTASGGKSCLSVIDISDPRNPKEIGFYDTGIYSNIGDINTIQVIGRYAYALTTNSFHVFDVSDPSNPELLGSSIPYNLSFGFYVSGSYAYIVGADYLRVVDISDPANHRRLGSCNMAPRPWAICVSNGYAYVVNQGSFVDMRAWIDRRLSVMDISDPNNPNELAFLPVDGNDICLSGNYLYISCYDEITVMDVSDPKDPNEIGSYEVNARDIHVAGSYVYVAEALIRVYCGDGKYCPHGGLCILRYTGGAIQDHPLIEITYPTEEETHTSQVSPIEIRGTASDNIVSVTWENATNERSGVCNGTTNWTCNVPLTSGDNIITITARDAAGNDATSKIIVILKDNTESEYFAVIASGDNRVDFINDANGLCNILLKSDEYWKKDHIYLLNNKDEKTKADRNNIKERIESIKPTANDFCLLFLSGHGEAIDDHSIFHTIEDTNDTKNVPHIWGIYDYELTDWLIQANWPPQSTLVVISACQSGGFIDALARKGFTVLTSDEIEKNTFKLASFDYGYVAFYMIQSLLGMADGILNSGKMDGYISLQELIEFCKSKNERIQFSVDKNFADINIFKLQKASDIQEKIEKANNGEEVRIPSGVYDEHLIIRKPIRLIGEKGAIFDAKDNIGSILISTDGVVIDGLNLKNGSYGIYLDNASNCLIANNTIGNITSGSAICLENGKSNKIRYNDISNSKISGIFLNNSGYNNVSNNYITGCGDISETNATPITKTGAAIILSESDNNLVLENEIADNISKGIEICRSSENQINNNNIFDNTSGIYCTDWKDGGIYYLNPTSNIFWANIISNNDVGFRISLSPSCSNSKNKIAHNNFEGNKTYQVWGAKDSQGNYWDNGYPSGGNYWSDYKTNIDRWHSNEVECTIDSNNDGIYDCPYTLSLDLDDPEPKDNYPLVKPIKQINETISNLAISVLCPVDLSIIDPVGRKISKTLNDINGGLFIKRDIDDDGDIDNEIIIQYPIQGQYSIQVVPDANAMPTDTYTLKVNYGESLLVEFKDIAIKDIPKDGYIFDTETKKLAVTAVSEDKPILIIKPDRITIERDETFVVSIDAGKVTDLFGASFELQFDGDILEAANAKPGDALGSDVVFLNVPSKGKISVAISKKEGDKPFSGSGTLATIDFKAKADGKTEIAFDKSKLTLQKADGSPIPDFSELTIAPCEITVGQVSQAMISMEPSDVQVKPGDEFTLKAVVSDIDKLFGASFEIQYDGNVLEYVSSSAGDFMGSDVVFFSIKGDNAVNMAISMKAGAEPASGTGTLAEVKFKARSVGKSQVSYREDTLALKHPDGTPISVTVSNCSVTVGEGIIKGDVNNDGNVRSNDAILALRIASGLIEPTPEQRQAADMNGDGMVRSNDAILILREAAGLAAPGINALPIANGKVTVTLPESHGVAGERLIIPLKIDNAHLLAGGDICITYDDTVLRASGVKSNLMLVSNVRESGRVYISFAGVHGLRKDILADIQFNILRDSVSSLEFDTVELYQPDALPLASGRLNGRFISWAIPPERSDLMQNFPNPFNPETWIPYQLREGGEVTVRIHSITGELIRELKLGHKSAGLYVTKDRASYWDGKSDTGELVSSGVYFYTIQADSFSSTRKMTVMR